MSNRRAAELWRRDEPAWRVSTARGPESSRRKDWEEDYFQDVDILRRQLKPVLRFLARKVGRRWADVARQAERRCRESRAPRHLRVRLFRSLLWRIGVVGVKTPVRPQPVVVDRETGLIRRGRR